MPIGCRIREDGIMRLMQDSLSHKVLFANWREPDIARRSFNYLRQLFPTAPTRPADPPTTIVESRQDIHDLSFLDSFEGRQHFSKFLLASQRHSFATIEVALD